MLLPADDPRIALLFASPRMARFAWDRVPTETKVGSHEVVDR
jgi:hypothetical protein